MARRATDPDGALEPLAVRAPRRLIWLLDLVALGLGREHGRPANRSEALRFLLDPFVRAMERRQDLALVLAGARLAVIGRARVAVRALARRGAATGSDGREVKAFARMLAGPTRTVRKKVRPELAAGRTALVPARKKGKRK